MGEGKACASYIFPRLFSCTPLQKAFIQVASDVAIHYPCDALKKQVVFVCPTKPADWKALTNTLDNIISREGNEVSLKSPRAIYG